MDELVQAVQFYPAIDNHTHPLLAGTHKDDFAFEGLLSEAQGAALTEDAVHTLACYRATRQLSEILECENDWSTVKERRSSLDYQQLCKLCMEKTGIQCFLLDDGLDSEEICEDIRWHDKFTASPSKRIVRVEVVAQDILKGHIHAYRPITINSACSLLSVFSSAFDDILTKAATDPFVAGFKSIVCYRTGLDVSPKSAALEDIEESLMQVMKRFEQGGKLRLADKHFNDYIVRLTMEVAAKYNKPVQFHTGLGDADITLARSSPAHLQPLIAAFPNTPVVLLHASYPFTREAGYLAAVYKNVYLDFGEVFPFVSMGGQKNVVRQVLELCPTSKLLWSTDGHWWPETYYLAAKQTREVLLEVLTECVTNNELTVHQAAEVARNALFYNANKLYKLGLVPDLEVGAKAA